MFYAKNIYISDSLKTYTVQGKNSTRDNHTSLLDCILRDKELSLFYFGITYGLAIKARAFQAKKYLQGRVKILQGTMTLAYLDIASETNSLKFILSSIYFVYADAPPI